MENQKLGFLEFKETFYSLLINQPLIYPEIITYYKHNFDDMLPDLYNLYTFRENYSILDTVKSFSIFSKYFNL